ncbi:MAG: hypothetical protein ABI175_20915 [Polyangiales bacterium]
MRLLVTLVATFAVLAGPRVASAQVSTAGSASSVAPPTGTGPVRWPDVAHDAKTDVYLAVSGAGAIMGQYFSADGAPLETAFAVQAGASFAQAPRVASIGSAYLVTWHETVGTQTRVRARILKHGAPAVTGDFDVSPLGSNWEMGAATAYSKTSDVALVAWQAGGGTLAAQRVSATGALLGGTIAIDPGARYHRDPSLAWNAATDEFVIAYGGCDGTDDCFGEARRISAAGAFVGGAIGIDAHAKAVYTPELAHNAITHETLVVWHRRDAAAAFFSRRILRDGSLGGDSVLVTATYTSYDANGLAWDPISNTFLFVTHSDAATDAAIELSAQGAPLDPKMGVRFGPSSAGGNFNPRVAAANGRAEWMAVTSTEFKTLTAQRFVTLTRDPAGVAVDGGVIDAAGVDAAGVDAGADASIAPPPDAGIDAASTPAADFAGEGCACTTKPAARTPLALFLAPILALALACARARRAR